MIFNKSYLTTFSKTKPLLALASKGKILDSKFTLTSELSLYDYSLDTHYPALQTDSEYCKISWCDKDDMQLLAAGHTNGTLALYEPDTDSSFKLLKSFDGLTNKVLGIDYNPSKNVIAAGSSKGNIIFWNLDKIDQQYKCDIPISENITSLSWNNKVSRILCAGTDCGKILVLDIRAKNIAMTIQNKDIKSVSNVRWHPKCSTSIFATTNLNHLACFKLDANSMTQIGSHDSSMIDFNIIDEDTVASYSDNKIDYIDVDTLSVRESVNVENAFDISFSRKDPLYCCSYNSGTTEVFCKSDKLNIKKNPHIQLNDYIVGREIFKISDYKLEISQKDDIETRILDILYKEKDFVINKDTRKKLGDLLLGEIEEVEKEEGKLFFNLSDKLILNLIKNNIDDVREELMKKDRTISMKFFVNAMISKNCTETISDPLYFLLSLLITKNYDNLSEYISSKQWRIIVSLLLFSDLSDEEVIKKIQEIIEKNNLPILNLLINEPRKYFNSREDGTNLPNSVYEIRDFFKKYGSKVINLKKLNLKYDNPLLNEYFWFGKNHGIYEQLKDIGFEDKIIRMFIDKKEISISNLSIKTPVINLAKKPLTEILNKTEQISTRPPAVKTPSTPSRPSLYSGSSNKSVTSFSTKPLPRTLSKESNLQEKPSGFSTKPMPSGRTLYSALHNKSATSFSTKPESSVVNPPIAKSVSTYGQSTEVKSPSSVYSTFKPTAIPKPSFKGAPTPNNTMTSQVSQQNEDLKYDRKALSQSLEKIFNSLKIQASKKNSLIVGNKIKDAVRRFSIFQQVNKDELSVDLLGRIEEILSILGNENDKNILKQKVRVIVDECIEIKSCECHIWMPAISILVQLVY
jgi:protein transport protein SEC31